MYCPECGKDMRRSDRDPRYMVCDNCRKKFFRPIEDFYEDGDELEEPPVIREKRNACIIISLILTIGYLAYCVYYWRFSGNIVSDSAEMWGFNVAHALVMPHIVAVVIAFVFNWIGVILPNRWFILVGAIIYVIAMVLMPIYFMFVILQMILSFVGFGLMVSSRNKQQRSFAE